MNIIEQINSLSGVRTLPTQGIAEIENAESVLGLKFASEFIEYSEVFSAISAKNIELFGVTPHKRLSVVANTLLVRETDNTFPTDAYVIGNQGIEGVVVIQFTNGTIHKYSPACITKIADSLNEYLAMIRE